MNPIRVIKLGGSLLDLPDLPDRFNRYQKKIAQNTTSNQHERLLLVVGGGVAADVVRGYDKLYQLGDHHGHWLAVRAMQFNAHCVAHLLTGDEPAGDVQACQRLWQRNVPAVADPIAWLQHLENQGVEVPHRWSFTSDSIAALLAGFLGASVLTLLKSTLPESKTDATQAAAMGLVDTDFSQASLSLPCVELVNFRDDSFPCVRWSGEPCRE